MDKSHRTVPRVLVVTAVVVGAALGSYGIAAAASGSGSTSSSTTTAAASTAPAAPQQPPAGATAQYPQRSDETLLTGDTAAKVRQLALARIGSGATIVRVETDADGHAAYEAHMIEADGTPVTVYVDRQFDVVGVETR